MAACVERIGSTRDYDVAQANQVWLGPPSANPFLGLGLFNTARRLNSRGDVSYDKTPGHCLPLVKFHRMTSGKEKGRSSYRRIIVKAHCLLGRPLRSRKLSKCNGWVIGWGVDMVASRGSQENRLELSRNATFLDDGSFRRLGHGEASRQQTSGEVVDGGRRKVEGRRSKGKYRLWHSINLT
jgi:hypothetical protein